MLTANVGALSLSFWMVDEDRAFVTLVIGKGLLLVALAWMSVDFGGLSVGCCMFWAFDGGSTREVSGV